MDRKDNRKLDALRIRRETLRSLVHQRGICRAVFTVEASFLLPMIMGIMLLLIVTMFFLHDRIWYRCAAYESALTGNAEAVPDKGSAESKAAQKANDRIEERVMPGSKATAQVHWNRLQTEVVYRGRLYEIFQNEIPELDLRVSIKRYKPETFVRLKWAARL